MSDKTPAAVAGQVERKVMRQREEGAQRCHECQHREWQEGDREYSPPGYGIYFCNLVPFPGVTDRHIGAS